MPECAAVAMAGRIGLILHRRDPDADPGGAPADEAEPSPTAAAPVGTGVPSAMPGLDVRSLGTLLTQGAALLQAVGRSLAQPPGTPAAPGGSAGIRPRIETDAATGQPELRIPVPDEKTIQQWMGKLSSLLGTVQPPQ